MKTRIFSLFAAMMLLFGAKAMAQTNGDVNEDGVVNEQDIEAVIKIMQEAGGVDGQYYYYVGQDPITADNYTTLAEVSNTLLKEKEYTTERYDYTYVLVPNSVTSIKVQQPGLGFWSDDSYQIDSTISIPGHVVYKTTGRCGASATILFEFDYTPVQHPTTSTLKGDVNGDGVVDVADIAAVIKIMTDNGSIETKYYYYIGLEEITADNYMTLAEARTTTLPARRYSDEGKGKLYILVPDIVTSIKLKDFNAGAYMTEGGYSIDASISIPGHKVYVTTSPGSFGGGASLIVEYYYE